MNKIATGLLGLAICAPGAVAIDLDPTFGRMGIVTDYRLRGVSALAVLADGRILVARSDSLGALLGRYERDGSPDTGFGVGGVLEPPLPVDSYVRGMVLQPDGRILIAGSSASGGFLVARLLANGDLDPSFGGTGYATLVFPEGSAGVSAVALQSDGKVVVVGTVSNFVPIPSQDYAAARFLADGTPDASFGSGGRVVLDLGGRLPEFTEAMVLQPDGRLVVAGLTNAPSGSGCGMARLLENGTLDPSFGTSGLVFPHDVWDCKALALLSDGRLIVGGASKTSGLVMRLQPDGAFDVTFGNGGVVPTSRHINPANAVALDSRGRIVLAGEGGGREAVFLRLLPDGSPDRAVGPEGWTSTGLGGGPPHYTASATSLSILLGDGILLGVDHIVFVQQAALVKYIEGDVSTIPTLSEIGTILFAALLGLAGLLAIRRGA